MARHAGGPGTYGTPSPTNHSRLSRADGSMSSAAANRRSRVRCMYLFAPMG
jgi:hypothetical protein